MLSAILEGIQFIIGMFSNISQFLMSIVTGLWNLLRMLPQGLEAISIVGFTFPYWFMYPLMNVISLVIALAVIKWIKGIF